MGLLDVCDKVLVDQIRIKFIKDGVEDLDDKDNVVKLIQKFEQVVRCKSLWFRDLNHFGSELRISKKSS